MLPRYSSHHPTFMPLISPPTDFVYTSPVFSICVLWGLVFLNSRNFALPFPLGRNSGSFLNHYTCTFSMWILNNQSFCGIFFFFFVFFFVFVLSLLTIQLRKSYLFCYLGRNSIKKEQKVCTENPLSNPSTLTNGFMKWGIKGVSPPTNAQKMRKVWERQSFWTAHARPEIETIFCFSIQIHDTITFIIFFYTIKILFL